MSEVTELCRPLGQETREITRTYRRLCSFFRNALQVYKQTFVSVRGGSRVSGLDVNCPLGTVRCLMITQLHRVVWKQ